MMCENKGGPQNQAQLDIIYMILCLSDTCIEWGIKIKTFIDILLYRSCHKKIVCTCYIPTYTLLLMSSTC